ncbi:MAG: DMT family transporter [Proteobacteria bacterium]|nr:DMT family transporter [Pseudomonadota bacterium]
MRFAVAAVSLGIVLAATGKLKWRDYSQPWRYLVLGGVFIIFFILMFESLKTATAITTAAIFTLMPFMAGAMDRVITGRRQTRIVSLGLCVGVFGALWVIFDGSIHSVVGFKIGRGEILFFLGTLAHALYAVLVPVLRRGEPVYSTTFGVMVSGALILFIFFWPSIISTDWSSLGLLVTAIILYLAIFAGLGSFTLVTIASIRLSSAKLTAYTYLIPFWVVFLESALGNGWPNFIVLLGGGVIIIALLMLFSEREINK